MWSPPDPISGFSHHLVPPRTDPGPGTDKVAHLQRQEAERRLAAGLTRGRGDVDPEANRRAMLKAFGRGRD